MSKSKIGVCGLTGCAGDQLVLLNCEDELLDIAGAFDIEYFQMAMSDNDRKCHLDIVFVDGSVVQPRDQNMLRRLRERSTFLVAIGTCAVWGGVQAMKNKIPRKKLKKQVYGQAGKVFEIIAPQHLSHFVKVDLAISGCPVEKEQLLQAVASLFRGDLPCLPNYPVCTECKMAEYPCVLFEKGQLCLGPITMAGCKARCPCHVQPCIGCRGPVEEANVASEVKLLQDRGFTWSDIHNRLRTFAAQAGPFKIEYLKEAANAKINSH